VNCKFAVRLLEKRGHSVVSAANGKEALDLLERASGDKFDLVLMDVQMPVMDGVQATCEIRRKENGNGKHIPIIAMTAHALKGDRERCLAAGMDGYVSKPIDPEQLFKTLEDLAGAARGIPLAPLDAEGAGATIEPYARTKSIYDRASALARTDGDTELLGEMMELFLNELPNLLSSVQEAVAGRNSKALETAAHKLKGSIGNFAAQPAYEAALKLELIGRDGDVARMETAHAALLEEIKGLQLAMASSEELGVEK
jgi:two-component system, sensor histidine kinase and response regulator